MDSMKMKNDLLAVAVIYREESLENRQIFAFDHVGLREREIYCKKKEKQGLKIIMGSTVSVYN
jgi:hypothetical protein